MSQALSCCTQNRAALTAVRPLGTGLDRDFVVQVTSPIPDNSLYHCYRALVAIGVQVIHTTLRLKGGNAIQTLHLAELNDAALGPPRVAEVLAALNGFCMGSALRLGNSARASV